MRRGRPGLIGTMARTAVIAGTASATVNAVNGKAQQKAAAQQQAAAAQQAEQQQMADMQAQMAAMQQQLATPAPAAPAPVAAAPAAGPQSDVVAQLTQLKGLVDAGILTQEEFDAKKKLLLGI